MNLIGLLFLSSSSKHILYNRLGEDREVWGVSGVDYRDEPEFETGQIVVDSSVVGDDAIVFLRGKRVELYHPSFWWRFRRTVA